MKTEIKAALYAAQVLLLCIALPLGTGERAESTESGDRALAAYSDPPRAGAQRAACDASRQCPMHCPGTEDRHAVGSHLNASGESDRSRCHDASRPAPPAPAHLLQTGLATYLRGAALSLVPQLTGVVH